MYSLSHGLNKHTCIEALPLLVLTGNLCVKASFSQSKSLILVAQIVGRKGGVAIDLREKTFY